MKVRARRRGVGGVLTASFGRCPRMRSTTNSCSRRPIRRATRSRAIDEHDAAAMCYTSGTTGRPKGVLYSHRAIMLHSLAQGLRDSLAIAEDDTVLPIVPMFHVNAWGLPFTATWFGCNQVYPGPHLDRAERAVAAALRAGDAHGWRADGLARRPSGARPAPRAGTISERVCEPSSSAAARRRSSMIRAYQERHNLKIIHAWGMTEMTPLGTLCNLPASMADAHRRGTVSATVPSRGLRCRSSRFVRRADSGDRAVGRPDHG